MRELTSVLNNNFKVRLATIIEHSQIDVGITNYEIISSIFYSASSTDYMGFLYSRNLGDAILQLRQNNLRAHELVVLYEYGDFIIFLLDGLYHDVVFREFYEYVLSLSENDNAFAGGRDETTLIGIESIIEKIGSDTYLEILPQVQIELQRIQNRPRPERPAPTARFTNSFGTPTTICARAGCNEYIASSGDTHNCETHSGRCIGCNIFIDGDALMCLSCIERALRQ